MCYPASALKLRKFPTSSLRRSRILANFKTPEDPPWSTYHISTSLPYPTPTTKLFMMANSYGTNCSMEPPNTPFTRPPSSSIIKATPHQGIDWIRDYLQPIYWINCYPYKGEAPSDMPPTQSNVLPKPKPRLPWMMRAPGLTHGSRGRVKGNHSKPVCNKITRQN